MSQQNQVELGQIIPSQETRLGRMLTAGRLTATMRSKRTGEHVTLTLNSMKKIENKWEHVLFADASHVFIQMGQGGYGSTKVGTFYPNTGKLFFGTPDKAWRYAAIQTLKAAASGVQDTDCFDLQEEERCGKCGLKLTDPVSISRGIGPTCLGALTGSVHYTQREENLVEVTQQRVAARAELQRVVTRPQDVAALAEIVASETDTKGRNVPRTFEALVASVKS